MQGAIRRAQAIRSGRLEYRFETGALGAKAPTPSRISRSLVSFVDSDWIVRRGDGSRVSLQRNGLDLQYEEIIQQDGRVNRSAILTHASPLPNWESEDRPPWFVGTFWHHRQLEYAREHRSEFRLAMPRQIDGIHCEVCELDVPLEELARVVLIVHPLLRAGGMLRLHIASQLGYAMPLIEITAPDGAKVVTYQSSGFLKLPDDIYFPRKSRTEMQLPTGVAWYQQFNITPEQINQRIPDSDFVIEIPPGTQVRDERDANRVRRFNTTVASTSAEFVGEVSPKLPEAKAKASRHWVLPLAGALVVLFVCLLIAIRYVRTSAA